MELEKVKEDFEAGLRAGVLDLKDVVALALEKAGVEINEGSPETQDSYDD